MNVGDAFGHSFHHFFNGVAVFREDSCKRSAFAFTRSVEGFECIANDDGNSSI